MGPEDRTASALTSQALHSSKAGLAYLHGKLQTLSVRLNMGAKATNDDSTGCRKAESPDCKYPAQPAEPELVSTSVGIELQCLRGVIIFRLNSPGYT